MNYTLNQLRIFLKIVQTQSVTKASEELHLTQPAVSIQLKNFQDQFHIPLTEIVGRKIYVTDFGKEIAEAAQQILDKIETINHRTLAFKGQLYGKLKISVVSTGKYVMPYFLSDYLKVHPGIELQMDVTNKSKVVKSIQNNEVDFALVSILPDKIKVDKVDLMPNKLYFVGNQSLKMDKNFKLDNLLEESPLLFRENGSGTRQAMEKFIQQKNITIPKKIELTSNEAIKQAILAGLGYSVMPLIGIRREILSKELQIIPIKGLPIITNWSLIWPKGKNHSPAATAFLEYLQNEKNNIIHEHFGWYENM